VKRSPRRRDGDVVIPTLLAALLAPVPAAWLTASLVRLARTSRRG
jgi:hypothetical protein